MNRKKVGLKTQKSAETRRQTAEKGRISAERKRKLMEKIGQAAEIIRWESMKEIRAQEMTHQSTELVYSSLLDRIQNYIEQIPQVIEDFRRAAANQLVEMEKISASAKKMLQATQQMIRDVCAFQIQSLIISTKINNGQKVVYLLLPGKLGKYGASSRFYLNKLNLPTF